MDNILALDVLWRSVIAPLACRFLAEQRLPQFHNFLTWKSEFVANDDINQGCRACFLVKGIKLVVRTRTVEAENYVSDFNSEKNFEGKQQWTLTLSRENALREAKEKDDVMFDPERKKFFRNLGFIVVSGQQATPKRFQKIDRDHIRHLAVNVLVPRFLLDLCGYWQSQTSLGNFYFMHCTNQDLLPPVKSFVALKDLSERQRKTLLHNVAVVPKDFVAHTQFYFAVPLFWLPSEQLEVNVESLQGCSSGPCHVRFRTRTPTDIKLISIFISDDELKSLQTHVKNVIHHNFNKEAQRLGLTKERAKAQHLKVTTAWVVVPKNQYLHGSEMLYTFPAPNKMWITMPYFRDLQVPLFGNDLLSWIKPDNVRAIDVVETETACNSSTELWTSVELFRFLGCLKPWSSIASQNLLIRTRKPGAKFADIFEVMSNHTMQVLVPEFHQVRVRAQLELQQCNVAQMLKRQKPKIKTDLLVVDSPLLPEEWDALRKHCGYDHWLELGQEGRGFVISSLAQGDLAQGEPK